MGTDLGHSASGLVNEVHPVDRSNYGGYGGYG